MRPWRSAACHSGLKRIAVVRDLLMPPHRTELGLSSGRPLRRSVRGVVPATCSRTFDPTRHFLCQLPLALARCGEEITRVAAVTVEVVHSEGEYRACHQKQPRFVPSECGEIRYRDTLYSWNGVKTVPSDFLVDFESTATTLSLGAFGDVSHMKIDTINFLIQALEERKRILVGHVPEANDGFVEATNKVRSVPHNSIPGNQRSWCERVSDEGSEGDEGRQGLQGRDPQPHTTAPRHVRSRSYEALAKLEQILEARHQQLMNDGALDGPSSLTLDGSPRASSSLTDEIRKLQQSFLREARGTE